MTDESEKVNQDAEVPASAETERNEPRPIDVVSARLDGMEAVIDWIRNVAVMSAMLAIAVAVLVAFLMFRKQIPVPA